MALVSKLELLSQGTVTQGQFGDLAVLKGFAYVQSGANCAAGKGGFHAVDIRDPAAPAQLSFIPSLPDSAHDDGVQAITIDTADFSGDVLAVSNQPCVSGGPGGFDLYDVSNPAAPVTLVQGFGDGAPANPVRSLAIWDAGTSAYAATVDSADSDGLDVFDITNPSTPQPLREYNVRTVAPGAFTETPNFSDPAHRGELVVRQIGGRFKLLVAAKDGGYIQFDAQDPADLQYEADSDFPTSDPLTGFDPPEGNANHADYSADNRFLATAEDDSEPFRVDEIDIEDVGARPGAIVPGAVAPHTLADEVMNGAAAYVGYACSGSDPVPTPAAAGMPAKEPGEEWIAVAQRGPVGDSNEDYNANGDLTDDGCLPGEKAFNADAAGWDAVLIANRHTPGGPSGDAAFCGSGAFVADSPVVAVCTSHAAFHNLFDDAVDYTIPYDDETEGPAIGTQAAHELTVEGSFDGWGYMSLYSTTPDGSGKFPLADAFAIREALNPDFALGFGDLSIQEQATDPTEPLSYASHNAAGVRVFSFESGKITEQGAFIDVGGNNVAGVEQFTGASGERLIAASDRDYGLYILRYTGPLAARPPACTDTSAGVPGGGSVTVALACSDPNGNTLTRHVVSGPSAGTLSSIDQAAGTVTYTNAGRAGGSDSFQFAASDGAASSAPATVTLAIAPTVCCALPVDPRILGLTLRPSTFRAFPRGGSVRAAAAPRGTRVSYRLSKAARGRFTVARLRKGRRPQRLRGSFTHAGAQGANVFRFTGRLARKKLRPGRYRLTMRATDADGRASASLSARFKIVR